MIFIITSRVIIRKDFKHIHIRFVCKPFEKWKPSVQMSTPTALFFRHVRNLRAALLIFKWPNLWFLISAAKHSVYKTIVNWTCLVVPLCMCVDDYRSSWKRTTVSWADSRETKTSAAPLRTIRRRSWKSCSTWPPGCKPRPVKRRTFKRCVHVGLVNNALGIRILCRTVYCDSNNALSSPFEL